MCPFLCYASCRQYPDLLVLLHPYLLLSFVLSRGNVLDLTLVSLLLLDERIQVSLVSTPSVGGTSESWGVRGLSPNKMRKGIAADGREGSGRFLSIQDIMVMHMPRRAGHAFHISERISYIGESNFVSAPCSLEGLATWESSSTLSHLRRKEPGY